ncbi:MAG: hypothetical protein ABIN36_05350 [Ferruginibacter sp.]
MKITLTLLFSFLIILSYGQKTKTYFPVWTFHQKNSNIYGLSVGLWNFSTNPRNTTTNGLRFSLIGEGLIVPLIPSSPVPENDSLFEVRQKTIITEKVNGINISGTGTAGDFVINGISVGVVGQIEHKVTGISAAILMNFAQTHNGIQIAAYNETYKMKGLQIGLLNKSKRTKGIQIGLWNINEKRKLPLINWNFFE